MILEDKLLALALAGFALCGAGYFSGRNNVAFSLILSVTMICLFFLGVFDGAGDLICGMEHPNRNDQQLTTENDRHEPRRAL
ncbi:hypothetical protein [Pseudomonas aeruginosa]|uniref:hypothetical protein n=1 Tax=Pseudomonas aeruginosa TaxID=287 RepID=UPI001F4117E3|nr:hypothetical protein [Pseudomonas aeruginosa]